MALKKRLTGHAADLAVYFANERERAKLCQDDGVRYFLKTLRAFLIKGSLEVFLYRFIQLIQFKRGTWT